MLWLVLIPFLIVIIPSSYISATSQCITHDQALLSQPRVNHATASWSSPGGESGIAMFAGGTQSLPLINVTNTVDVFQKIGQGIPGTWWNTTISIGRQNLVGTSNMDRIFFAGGLVGQQFTDVVDIFDIPTRSWTTDALSLPRADMAAASVGIYTLFIGGQGASGWTNVIDIYNGNTGDWLPVIYLSVSPNWVSATTCGVWVMITGYDPLSGTNLVWFFNGVTGALWSSTTALVGRTNFGSATVTVNNNIFIGGGVIQQISGGTIINNVDLWTCTASTILGPVPSTASTTMPYQLTYWYGISTVLNKYVVIGGGGNVIPSAQVAAYNVNTNAWIRSIPQLSTPRTFVIAATVGNTVLFAGGWGDGPIVNNMVDIYTFAC